MIDWTIISLGAAVGGSLGLAGLFAWLWRRECREHGETLEEYAARTIVSQPPSVRVIALSAENDHLAAELTRANAEIDRLRRTRLRLVGP